MARKKIEKVEKPKEEPQEPQATKAPREHGPVPEKAELNLWSCGELIKYLEVPGVVRAIKFQPGGDAERMLRHLALQPKVRYVIPRLIDQKADVPESVNINGFRLDIKRGVFVNLPEQVAELLQDAYYQTQKALDQFRIDMDPQKADALK